MDILSASIARVVEIARSDGNAVALVSDGFSKPRQVVFMRDPLSPSGKSAIAAELPKLRHFRSERTPHNPAHEGFVDEEGNVVISFPIAGERFRWA